MTTPLFRLEAVEARRAQWLGSIRIGRPYSFAIATAVSTSCAIALICFGCWGEITRKVTVHGLLLPIDGLIHIGAPQAGIISEILVKEGDTVAAGQPIARLRSERMTATGDTAAITAQALRSRRLSFDTEKRLTEQGLNLRQESLAQRIQSLQAEERQAQAELETVRFRVTLATKTLERQQELALSGFVAAAQLQAKQEELLDLQLRERSVERSLQGVQRDLQTVKAEKTGLENQTQTALSQLQRALAALDQESAENGLRNEITLTAPHAGFISVLPLNPGQAVQATSTVASLVPMGTDGKTSELRAQLFAPSRAVGFAQIGQPVFLRYAAFPYQKFGMAEGEIIAISRSPILPQDLPAGQAQALLAAAQANEPMHRITVKLPSQSILTYGRTSELTAGMTLDADIRLERRRIFEWLLEPAFAVSRGVTNLR